MSAAALRCSLRTTYIRSSASCRGTLHICHHFTCHVAHELLILARNLRARCTRDCIPRLSVFHTFPSSPLHAAAVTPDAHQQQHKSTSNAAWRCCPSLTLSPLAAAASHVLPREFAHHGLLASCVRPPIAAHTLPGAHAASPGCRVLTRQRQDDVMFSLTRLELVLSSSVLILLLVSLNRNSQTAHLYTREPV